MSKVKIEVQDAIAVLRLTNGVTNAISPELVDDLSAVLKRVKYEFKGLVLAGGEKFFCIGLDLPGLLQLDRSEMTDFYVAFNQVVLDLYTFPTSTASAIAGHATAGGAILAMSTDFRLVAEDRKFIGLNEVKIGVPVPRLADLILRQLVGDRRATEMMYSGEFLEPEQSYSIGLVDAVVPAEILEKEAVAKIATLAALPSGGIMLIKKNRVETVRLRYEKMRESETDEFLSCWFNPSVQKLLGEAAKKF
jgi:enoyl-CoA hydratase/carnithine racemase